jgi:tellurite methyltransferase
LNLKHSSENGVYELPDLSSRYLITERKIGDLLNKYSIELREPIKTVNVSNLRCMTTLVMIIQ